LPIPVIVLFGPTASGKTALLERLFNNNAADRVFKAEIVSADSMQVYKGMDIGTAKPSAGLRERLPHHLIDIRTPDQSYNVGDFVRLADLCVEDITKRGLLPVVSGGTGFYLKNFIQGLPESPPSDACIREELKETVRKQGVAPLIEELRLRDPVSASRIHANDSYRLLRALEVFRLTGKPLSGFAMNGSGRADTYCFLIIGLSLNRELLYKRINERCAQMFQNGLAREVRGLLEAGFNADSPGMRAIGYREFFEFFPSFAEKSGLEPDFSPIEALVAQHSRNYAKRQITYFASIPDVQWVNIERDGEDAVAIIRKTLNIFCNIPPRIP
jgi:tRNA dimethylallyltransferase